MVTDPLPTDTNPVNLTDPPFPPPPSVNSTDPPPLPPPPTDPSPNVKSVTNPDDDALKLKKHLANAVAVKKIRAKKKKELDDLEKSEDAKEVAKASNIKKEKNDYNYKKWIRKRVTVTMRPRKAKKLWTIDSRSRLVPLVVFSSQGGRGQI